MSNNQGEDQEENGNTPPPSIVEWIIRVTCLSIVLSLLGYFVHGGIMSTGEVSINIQFNSSEAEERSGAWVIPVSIVNDSEIGVQQLTVEAVLNVDGETIAKELSNPILGAQEAIDAEFWFDTEPTVDNIKFNVVSYVIP